MTLIEAMQFIIDRRGGKTRILELEPYQYTYYVHQIVWDDALANGYIDAEGVVTDKFKEEYNGMFDRIGKFV